MTGVQTCALPIYRVCRKFFTRQKKAGAVGVALSGAGPCLIAFSPVDKHIENNIAVEMVQAFKKNEVQADALILDLDTRGAFVV